MWKHRRTWVAMIAGVLAVVATVFLLRSREPHYKEQPLSHWVERFGWNPHFTTEERQFLVSLDLDSNAIPYLLKWLQYAPKEDGLAASIYDVLERLDRKLGNPFSLYEKCVIIPRTLALGSPRALTGLGSEAALAIPELKRLMLTSESEETRHRAAYALGLLGDLGLPVLTAALTNANPDVRGVAAYHLQWLDTNGQLVVPRLREMLADEDGNVRSYAAMALGVLAPEAITNKAIKTVTE